MEIALKLFYVAIGFIFYGEINLNFNDIKAIHSAGGTEIAEES